MPTVDYEAKVERTLDRIESSESIHPTNKEAIREFTRDLKLDGLSDAWLSKLTGHLIIIAEHLEDTRFEAMDTDDVKDLVEWAHDRDVSERTVGAYKQVIKRFWRWLYDMPKGEHPEMVDWINTGASSNGNGTLPKDLLTREDIDALKAGCRNDRDRAFIAMLYETGARIGELIDLTVGDIEDHNHGRKVVIDGKTGSRRLPLIEASPALNDWLNKHSSGRDDDPLWCKLQNSEDELSYHYIRQKLLPRAGRRAAASDPSTFANNPNAVDDPDEELEFHKPLNPHHFRHSRATELANKFKEAQLCEWFGWVQGSDVPARYVHLSGRDIDDAYNELHGLKTEEEKEEERTVITCWRCDELNEAARRFCGGCGAALDIEAANEVETAQESGEEMVLEVENEIEARILKNVQREIRENPEAYLATQD
jgi:integrase